MTRYRTIVADPPWPYESGFVAMGTNHTIGGIPRPTSERSPITRQALPYPSMPMDQIRALPISRLAMADARLFCWATMRYLPVVLDLVNSWGFAYKQTIVWDKTPNFQPLGGSVAPNAAEFLVVATKGSPAILGRWATSVIRARKARTTHSRKPDVFLDLVETVSPGPYLEMFARRNRLGWDTWGNESLEHVEMGA